jgi:acyl-CoA dehydrogenase
VQAAVRKFELHSSDPQSLSAIDVQIALNFLKVECSELAVTIVMSAMRACGLSGYRNDSEFTMGRYLRDILSSPIMINNDRILADSQTAVLMSDAPAGLSE